MVFRGWESLHVFWVCSLNVKSNNQKYIGKGLMRQQVWALWKLDECGCRPLQARSTLAFQHSYLTGRCWLFYKVHPLPASCWFLVLSDGHFGVPCFAGWIIVPGISLQSWIMQISSFQAKFGVSNCRQNWISVYISADIHPDTHQKIHIFLESLQVGASTAGCAKMATQTWNFL